jgi:hypothetical protein
MIIHRSIVLGLPQRSALDEVLLGYSAMLCLGAILSKFFTSFHIDGIRDIEIIKRWRERNEIDGDGYGWDIAFE